MCLCVYTLYVLVWMYTSRNFKQCPAGCQWFNIFLLPTFWRNFLSVADSIPLRETASQAESLGRSLVRQEGLLKAAQLFCSQGEQSSCCRMQNRTPSCITSCSGCGAATQEHQEGEVLLAQQGDTVPQAGCPQLPGPAVAAEVLGLQWHCCHACDEDKRQRLMRMNWYTGTLVPVQISPLRSTRTVRFIWRYKCVITALSFSEPFFLTFKTGTVFLCCCFVPLLSLLLALKRSGVWSGEHKIWMVDLIDRLG